MKKAIIVLEDNHDRREAMRAWLDERLSMYRLMLTDDPVECIQYIRECSGHILAASLDHDLYDRADRTTTLTGMDVVDFLVQTSPAFPVLLHTSNRLDGERMQLRLKKIGWNVTWVVPFDGTEWVGKEWYPTLKHLIRKTALSERLSASNDQSDTV